MNDQYKKLREMVKTRTDRRCRTIAVTSGKGGVGKTSISANLALALQNLGFTTTLVDADTQFANVDVVFGVRPKQTLSSVILKNAKVEDIILNEDSGLKIVPGSSGTKEFLHLSEIVKDRLLYEIWNLERLNEFIILDTGSGLSPLVLELATRSDEIILITTPEATAITDTYAMAKILYSYRDDLEIKLLLNFVNSENEARDIFEKLTLVIDHFLGKKISMLGFINRDEIVRAAIIRQKPFVQTHPNSKASKCLQRIAHTLSVSENQVTEHGGQNELVEYVN